MKNQALRLLIMVTAAAPAAADEGEFFVSVAAVPEVAWVSHPLSSDAVPFGPSSTTTFLPRAGLQVSYGLNSNVALAAGVDGSVFANLTSKGVVVDDTRADLATAARVDVLVPLGAVLRYDSGLDFSGQLELSAGPAVVGWLGNVPLSPNVVGENGLPTQLSLTVDDQWNLGGFARVALVFEVGRAFEGIGNGFLFDVGVVTTATWTDTLRAVDVGLLLRPTWAWGGPFL